MDLRFTAEQEAFRTDARRWLEENVPPRPLASLDTAEGFAQHREWERRMFEARWSVVAWPAEYGGRDVGLIEWLVFEEEYYRMHAPTRVNQNGIFLLGPTLLEFGTTGQRERFLPRIASSEEVWCQGWSEPGAGSDLAAISSSAVRDGEGYVLNGQKTWCSRGAFADWMFGLFRTDPTQERHRGLTYLMVRLDSPGVTVRPIEQLDGEPGFAEVFFDDVRVPAAQVIGGENRGWQVAMATASSERGVSLRSPARFVEAANRLVELYGEIGSDGDAFGPGPDVVDAWMAADAYRLYTYWTVSRLRSGAKLGAETSINKIFWSELDVAIHETALRLLGHRAELLPGAPDVHDGGVWLDGYLFSLAGPIYAGTNEVQRNVVAERVLGLPRGA